jgi:hypothetical protein
VAVVTLPPPAQRGPHTGFLVAHRAGNDTVQLREAERLGARLVEADLRLHRGRIEVRHLKSVGPLPIYWDTWHLGRPFARHMQLAELLDAIAPSTELMLDLKGRNPRLARAVRAELCRRDASRRRHVTVCARSWRLLDVFATDADVRTVCSVGSKRGLRRLFEHAQRRSERLGGVSIHERLLDADVVRELSSVADLVMTWPVNTTDRAHTLLGWGVHGLITDRPDALVSIVPSSLVPAIPATGSAA